MAGESPRSSEVKPTEESRRSIAAIMATLAHIVEAEVGVGPEEIRSAFDPEDPECDRSRKEILGWLALLDDDDMGAVALKSGAFDSLKTVPENETNRYERPALTLAYIAADPAPEP